MPKGINEALGLPTLLDTDLTEEAAEAIIAGRAEEIADYLHILRADKGHSVLIVLQGMDAAGKSGAIRNIFAQASPANVRVKAFKQPTAEELEHDFLWRVHQATPRRGEVVIFDRSHYEDILIQRVHKWIDMAQVRRRMASINAFERLLIEDNKTLILKFFLNISYEQQAIELQERIDEPDNRWKHNPQDWEERKLWDEYMKAYRFILDNSEIPWYPTPVDIRFHRDLFMTEIILKELKKLDLHYPGFQENYNL